MLKKIASFFLLAPLSLLADDHYRAEFNSRLDKVTVEACFDGEAPSRLYRHAEAGQFTKHIKWGELTLRTSSHSKRVTLPSLPPDSCVQWQVDLAKATLESDKRIKLQLEDSIVTSGNLWFWRDNQRRPIQVTVSLPENFSISTPWQWIRTDGNEHVFQVEKTPATWTSRIAVGRFPVKRIEVGGTYIRVATIGQITQQQRAKLESWMTTTAQSVRTVFGHFPRSQAQILIVAIGSRDDAVPWAHVVRGGGIASEFFVDETRPLREFNSDWTATHELSHMLLPYISSEDRWFSEGLASYYQNVLRARDGRITEKQAWQKLHSGFQRGIASTKKANPSESLAQATRSGWDSTMRVYWSGAAMMLEADAELRSLSNGAQSLDTALAALYECCFDAGKRWRARDVFTQLDQLTGFKVFTDLYARHVMNHNFPDMGKTYQRLGIELVNNYVRLKSDAPWSQIRHLIMNEEDAATSESRHTGSP